jgi:tyrosyl-tRNA synthetase
LDLVGEEINKRADEYWPIVVDIAQKNNIKRITRYTLVSI